MPLQLFTSMVSSSTTGRMVGGGGLIKIRKPRFCFRCRLESTQVWVFFACTHNLCWHLHILIETRLRSCKAWGQTSLRAYWFGRHAEWRGPSLYAQRRLRGCHTESVSDTDVRVDAAHLPSGF